MATFTGKVIAPLPGYGARRLAPPATKPFRGGHHRHQGYNKVEAMNTTEHDKARTPQHQRANVTTPRTDDGDDHQLPGIGYRRDKPTAPATPGQPVQPTTKPARGQAQFLLTGLGTLVPIAAFTVPSFRQKLLAALQDDASAARLNGVVPQGSAVANDFVARTPVVHTRGRYRLGLFPSLLLGALLGGGATLLYFSRKNADTRDDPQQFSTLRQPQSGQGSQQTPMPTISGAVKETAVTMVSQAQEILSEARNTGDEQSAQPTDERNDQQQTSLIDATSVEVLTADRRGETTPATKTPALSTQQPQATPPSSPADTAAAAVETPIQPQQQPTATTPPTASMAKRAEETTAPVPQPATAANATATPTAEVRARIKEHMPVVDSKGMRVGAVDRIEETGNIRLAKDGQGKNHWLPLRWVTRVDTHVHLGRTAQQVRREWKTSAPRAR